MNGSASIVQLNWDRVTKKCLCPVGEWEQWGGIHAAGPGESSLFAPLMKSSWDWTQIERWRRIEEVLLDHSFSGCISIILNFSLFPLPFFICAEMAGESNTPVRFLCIITGWKKGCEEMKLLKTIEMHPELPSTHRSDYGWMMSRFLSGIYIQGNTEDCLGMMFGVNHRSFPVDQPASGQSEGVQSESSG